MVNGVPGIGLARENGQESFGFGIGVGGIEILIDGFECVCGVGRRSRVLGFDGDVPECKGAGGSFGGGEDLCLGDGGGVIPREFSAEDAIDGDGVIDVFRLKFLEGGGGGFVVPFHELIGAEVEGDIGVVGVIFGGGLEDGDGGVEEAIGIKHVGGGEGDVEIGGLEGGCVLIGLVGEGEFADGGGGLGVGDPVVEIIRGGFGGGFGVGEGGGEGPELRSIVGGGEVEEEGGVLVEELEFDIEGAVIEAGAGEWALKGKGERTVGAEGLEFDGGGGGIGSDETDGFDEGLMAVDEVGIDGELFEGVCADAQHGAVDEVGLQGEGECGAEGIVGEGGFHGGDAEDGGFVGFAEGEGAALKAVVIDVIAKGIFGGGDFMGGEIGVDGIIAETGAERGRGGVYNEVMRDEINIKVLEFIIEIFEDFILFEGAVVGGVGGLGSFIVHEFRAVAAGVNGIRGVLPCPDTTVAAFTFVVGVHFPGVSVTPLVEGTGDEGVEVGDAIGGESVADVVVAHEGVHVGEDGF